MCNSVEILKKRDKFSKRLLEKGQKQEDLSQMEYSTEKRDFATCLGPWNGRNVRSFTKIVQFGNEIGA